jgi:endonuclease-8
MPEGDTIHRTAATLRRVLGGKRLTGFRSPLPALSGAMLEGRMVEAVEARGKHLLIRFDDGRALRSHMRMTGSWHVYRPGERWWKPPHLARAVLETKDFVAVCFQAPVVELIARRGMETHPALASLGPDVVADEFDAVEAVRRLRAAGEREIGEALLVQQHVSGIGNIYKSEALFLGGVNPFRRAGGLADEELSRLLAAARRLMRESVAGTARRTRRAGGPRYWVYRRTGRPCLRCGEAIRVRGQGSPPRSTWWCARCQPF